MRYPERIVCLTEETTETLYLLGQGYRVVGVSGYTVRPPEARQKPKVSAFISAKYDPPNPGDPQSGHTTFTVEDPKRRLRNPKAVYLPAAAREWRVDTYLEDGSGDLLRQGLSLLVIAA